MAIFPSLLAVAKKICTFYAEVLELVRVSRTIAYDCDQTFVADQRVDSYAKFNGVFTAPFGVDEGMVAARGRGGGGGQ